MEYGCEMGEMINPSLRTQVTQPPVRRSYQRSASSSSDRDCDPHQRPHHVILNMNKESRIQYQRPRNENHQNEMTRDHLVLARKALMDFGQTSTAHVKRSNQNKGFLFDDDGVDLLSRLADKRPEVIGGKLKVTVLEVGYKCLNPNFGMSHRTVV